MSWSIVLRAALVAALLAAVLPSTHAAEDASAITLPQAVARALRDSPQLARFPFRLRAAEALRDQAGRRPNPELALEVEHAAGTGAYGGLASAELTLSLSQMLELGGKRGLRRGLAEVEYAAVTQEQTIAELDVAAETARRFIAVVEAQVQRDLVRRRVGLANRTAAQVETRVNAGRSSQAERHKARVAMLEAGLAAAAAERELQIARRALATSWGAAAADFGVAHADFFALPDLGSLEALEARVLDGPDLARFVTERRRRESELALARSATTRNVTVGGGMRRYQATGDTAFRLGVSIPLGIADRNQGGIAAARERLGELDTESRAALLEVRLVIAAAWTRLAQARDTVTILHGEALLEAEQALSFTEQGYAAGRLSFLELSDAQTLLLSVQADSLHAAADYHRLLIELERLTGRPVVAR